MNKYDEEYEKMNLYDFADELVEPLNTVKQDLTKTIYIHYAKERDEKEKLEQENKELHNKIDKVIDFINSQSPDAGVSAERIKEILKDSDVDE